MILFSTHRFDMVEKVCSRAVILSAGRLAAEHRVPDERDGHSDSLETLFVRGIAKGLDNFLQSLSVGEICHNFLSA